MGKLLKVTKKRNLTRRSQEVRPVSGQKFVEKVQTADGPTDRRNAKAAKKAVYKVSSTAGEYVKGQHEKLDGTRIQPTKGGALVRVVIEDGKKFKVKDVRAAKQHMLKLGKAREEAEAVAKLRGEEPPPIKALAAQKLAPKVPKGTKPILKSKAASQKGSSSAKASSKEGKQEQQQSERQKLMLEQHATNLKLDGAARTSVSPEEWFTGEVLQRAKGKVWLRLNEVSGLPEEALHRLEAMNSRQRAQDGAFCEGAQGHIVPLAFADVSEKGLHLASGVALKFRLYTDNHGTGACAAESV